MKKRALGKTGISVSEIAFGCVELGMPYGIGIKSKEDMLPEEQAIQLLNQALDSGIIFFDTARMYGDSEQILGKAFNKRRNDIVLCTKCSHLRDPSGKLPSRSKIAGAIHHSFEDSIKALGTDYIDIFMLHQVDKEILENVEIMDTFQRLKKEGKIRATGLSTYTVEETAEAIELGVWDIIQLPFNLMDQRHETVFEKASQQGIGIVVRSVLLKGLLSHRGRNLNPALIDVENHITNLKEFVTQNNFSLPEFAIKFALSFPEVSSVLVGIDKIGYLEETLNAANGVYMDQKELDNAKQLSYPDPDFINLPHWDRMNWL